MPAEMPLASCAAPAKPHDDDVVVCNLETSCVLKRILVLAVIAIMIGACTDGGMHRYGLVTSVAGTNVCLRPTVFRDLVCGPLGERVRDRLRPGMCVRVNVEDESGRLPRHGQLTWSCVR